MWIVVWLIAAHLHTHAWKTLGRTPYYVADTNLYTCDLQIQRATVSVSPSFVVSVDVGAYS